MADFRRQLEVNLIGPVAMIQAVAAVVHENAKPKQAYDLYQTLRQQSRAQRDRRVAR